MADHLWIVLPHLGPGGAQKVALLAAEHFAALGWRVRVVSLLPDKLQVHRVPAGVALLDLGDAVAAARLGDHWNRSLMARARRFLRLWLHRLLQRHMHSNLQSLQQCVDSGLHDQGIGYQVQSISGFPCLREAHPR